MSDPLRLVVFDVDGTLVDSQGDIVICMHEAFEALGQTAPSRADIMRSIGLSLPETMARLAGQADATMQARLIESYKNSYFERRKSLGSLSTSPFFPDVRAVLEDLHAQPDTLLAIATGKSRRGLDVLLDAHEIRHLFISAQCADDHPSKPHPSMLLSALRDSGADSENAVMVGDTRFDLEMSKAAKMGFVGVSWGYHSVEALSDSDAMIDDMRALPDALRTLWERKE